MHLTPLAPRARLLFHLQALRRLVFFWVPFSVTAGAAVAATYSVPLGVLGAVFWLFFLFVLAVWWPSLAFDRWGYELRDSELLIARGVIIRSVTAIPTSRIQHVDTRQGVLERWMGLARVQVHTASGVGVDGMIPGLDAEVAASLRDKLVEVEGDDGV